MIGMMGTSRRRRDRAQRQVLRAGDAAAVEEEPSLELVRAGQNKTEVLLLILPQGKQSRPESHLKRCKRRNIQ
jgi:hypothetical protein